jgi:hypothetical protein
MECDQVEWIQGQSCRGGVEIFSCVKNRNDQALASAMRLAVWNDGMKAGFEVDQIHQVWIRVDSDRLIGQNDVCHACPPASPRAGGPCPGCGLVREMGQECTITKRYNFH